MAKLARGRDPLGGLVLACLLLIISGFPNFPDHFELKSCGKIPGFPTDLCFLPPANGKDRFIVTQKDGFVFLVEDCVVKATPFLDLRDRVNDHHDRGLSACAVHPDWNSNRFVFFLYTYENNIDDREGPKTAQVTRFKTDARGTQALKNSLTVILGSVTGSGCANIPITRDVMCTESFTHANGGLTWDPEKHLLVTIGDGGGNGADNLAIRAQQIDSLNGKLLRVDINGRGVQGNPFMRQGVAATANRAKVWGLGCRNPWRVVYDDVLKVPLVAEVGWSTWEEMNPVRAGFNMGWPCWEARTRNGGFSNFPECQAFNAGNGPGTRFDPVVFWNHAEGAAASALLRISSANSNWPAADQDWIYYTDYVFGWMRRARLNQNLQLIDVQKFAKDLGGPVSMKASPSKEIHYISLAAREVRKILHVPNTNPPEVEFINPPDGAQGVEYTTSIKITISKNVLFGSLNNGFTMRQGGNNNGPFIDGKLSFDQSEDIATFVPSQPLRTNTQYTITLTGLKDEAGRIMTNNFRSSFKTGTGFSTYFSDLEWLNVKNGVGPMEKDLSNGKGSPRDGTTIAIRGEMFEKGVGMNPSASVSVIVPTACKKLAGTVGIDDAVTKLDDGRSIVQVLHRFNGIQRVLLTSGVMTRVSDGVSFNLDVQPGATVTLTAEITGLNQRINRNRVSWGDMVFRCGSSIKAAPRVISFTPAVGQTNVNVQKDPEIKFSEPIDPTSVLVGIKFRDSAGNTVPFQPRFAESASRVVLGTGQLEFNSQYSIVVGEAVRGADGQRIQNGRTASFTTVQPPPSGLLVKVEQLKILESNGRTDYTFGNLRSLKVLKEGMKGVMKTFNRGIELKAPKLVKYNVQGCQSMWAQVGIEGRVDALDANAKLEFLLDSKVVKTMFLTGSTLAQNAFVPIGGKSVLGIRASINGDNPFDFEYVALGGARLNCNGEVRYLGALVPRIGRGPGYYANRAWNGGLISVRTQPPAGSLVNYKSGLTQHAQSSIRFELPGRCSKFISKVGVSYLSQNYGEMMFVAKGAVGATSTCPTQIMTGGDGPALLQCPMLGASNLLLNVLPGKQGVKHDLGVWGDAVVDCEATALNPECSLDDLPTEFVIGQRITYGGKCLNHKGQRMQIVKHCFEVPLHHCDPNCHTHMFTKGCNTLQNSFTVPDHGQTFSFEVKLTACTDAAGRFCDTVSKSIEPKLRKVAVTSNQAGFTVTADSRTGPGPLEIDAVVGALITVSAPRVQKGKTFARWEHNPSLGNTFTVRVRDQAVQQQTYSAEYR
uniref:Glycosyl hydrolase family 98 putative carbohydrate-binding module domain-containing protein n=1 Tax=Rhodosorus marinus TaxID=101924 RepID=A0A7S0G263_9RHOD|mmetsp:Transcript_12430/g.18022  ORF Transcript_12430/g.18022 Transcript_12430/m.18022 type:complete len:1276 (+) Transcript_12430:259-4086(+)